VLFQGNFTHFRSSAENKQIIVKMIMNQKILINRQETDVIPATDRGFQYGDGIFETLAVEEGIPLCLTEHLARLAYGCQRLRIQESVPASLQEEIGIVAGNMERGVVKIIISRGAGGRGYGLVGTGPATQVVAGFDWPGYPREYHEQGIETFFCETRLGCNPALAGMKHLNRLEQVLGRAECEEKGAPEGIMLDTKGNLIEGTMSNLFLIQGSKLITPDLTGSGVRGIIRDRIIGVAHEIAEIDIRAARLAPSALFHADGVFFCNSVLGIWPVKRFKGRRYAIGPIIRRLQRELVARRIILV